MSAYYNEFDPFAAEWLRQLIKAGHITPGDVDERSIADVRPDDLKGYTQCHFFAGIGGWAYALQLANWPADRPVWTGSCPCQPFSTAGRQKGKDDERHLWPVWRGLIRECRPPTIFGEQVASAIAHGWLDDVYQGLEAEGYAVGSAVLPACSVGAPHKRDRLWFVGQSDSPRPQPREQAAAPLGQRGAVVATSSNVAHTESARKQREPSIICGEIEGQGRNNSDQFTGTGQNSAWFMGQWIDCPDGKQRLIEPGVPLLAHGVPNRVGKLRGYGNAIVPQVAAEFIKGAM